MGCLESQALTLFVRRCVVIASDSVIAKPEGLKQSLDCFVALLLAVTVTASSVCFVAMLLAMTAPRNDGSSQ